MSALIANIPLSLYIHVPWCIKKCPYCDFNSHQIPYAGLDLTIQQQYLQALLADFRSQLDWVQGRKIHSVFIGGGTPSLISGAGYQWLFSQLKQYVKFENNAEITLEANPATVEHDPFESYLDAGINRLSLGVQTFHVEHLKKLGRIHTPEHAQNAIYQAKQAGFQRLNVDLMHGLPEQNQAQALFDLQAAIDAGATHLSWYQLTIEPNTVFYRNQPILPQDEMLADIQDAGEQLLRDHGFVQYEVSAWRKELPSQHNLNYWQFGDYLAIGAGAHGKVTLADGIYRFQKTRLPKDYLDKIPAPHLNMTAIQVDDLPFEFMMNALRLNDGVASGLYAQRTGLNLQGLQPILQDLRAKKLLQNDDNRLATTELGQRYLNSVLDAFL
ncbi:MULTISPECIES: radical SAM family heme chaperone HemW [unclassified Acinetobacter]|uniref:radical SAM family heme chaperone HemW n=1 Tax=unclassified Acinetobacter TaxID=196816 RepID=UPI0035B7D7BD